MSLFFRFLFLVLLLPVLVFGQVPVASFSTTQTSGCNPMVVQFSNTSTGTTASTTYSWNFGNSATSVVQSPSTTYTAAGSYAVTLTVTNPGPNGGTSTKTLTNYITVNPAPNATWTVSGATGCPPRPVTFTNTTSLGTPGAGTYLWSFGDGGSSSAASPTHVYTTSGTYSVTLLATNSAGCQKTVTTTNQVTVYPKPISAFSASSTVICNPPGSTTFTGIASSGTGPYSYAWAYGDGGFGAGATTGHSYAAGGPYDVRMITTDANGCKDTLLKPAYIQTSVTTASFTNATLCPGVAGQFTNTTVPTAVAATWSAPGANPSSSTAINPVLAFPAAGTYNVQLVATGAGGCLDTVVQAVTVSPAPVVAYTHTPALPCPAPATINFTNATSGATSYTWYFGDGSTSTAVNPSHTYAASGFYTDSLIAVSSAGCSAKMSKLNDVKIYNLFMAASALPSEGCVPLTVSFSNTLQTNTPSPPTVPYPAGAASYVWDFGDGSPTSGTAAPQHVYTAAGVYTVKITITTTNGCTIIDSLTVRAGTKPTAGFTYAPAVQCTHQPVKFANTSTNATDYIWSFGDGESTTSTSPEHKYLNPGTYTVSLTAKNNGCIDTFVVPNAVTSRPPNAKFGAAYSCSSPLQVSFTNQSQGATSQAWSFSDGTTATTVDVTKSFPAYGNYTARLVTFNSTYGCSDTMVQTVSLFRGAPVVTPDDTTLCWGDSAHLAGTYPGAIPASFNWQITAGAAILKNDTASATGYRFANPGRYTVRLIVGDAHGCSDTLLKPNYVTVARPIVGFKVSDTVGCTPFTAVFTDTSRNTATVGNALRTWRWGTGGGTTTALTTGSYTYNVSGKYDVRLIVTDSFGCKDSLTKAAYVEARRPAALFSANDTSACIGQVINFASGSTGAAPMAYSWDFGDGTAGTGATAGHAYASVGSYNVRLIVTDASGCKDTLIKPAGITLTRPVASFTASDTQAICPPLLVQFTNTSPATAVSYSWTFSNSTSSILPSPSNVYTAAGQYPVRLIVFDAQGCPDTAYKTIRVLGYGGALTYSPLVGCKPLAVQFTSTVSNVPSMIWDFRDGITATATGTSIQHIYQTPGIYVPRLIISDGQGCLATSQGTDTIRVDGVLAGFVNTPACIGAPVQFTDTSRSFFSPVVTRLWTFPGGVSTNTQNPVQGFPGAGNYNVQLIATNSRGCADTILRQITMRLRPVITAIADTVICVSDAVTLGASGGVSYQWTPTGTLDDPSKQNPKASPSVATPYIVTGTDAYGCTSTDTVRVGLRTKTTSATAGDVLVCSGSSVLLQASGAETYQWTPSTALSSPGEAVTLASPKTTTTYLVIAREGSCQPDTQKVKVTVNPIPDVNAGQDTRMVAGASVTLSATATDAESFRWTPAEGLSCTDCPVPVASPKKTTTYKLTATNRFGCSDTDDVVVTVQCSGSQLFVPNTFTPNGNGENDIFYPHGIGLDRAKSFRVYNRWGQVVFEKLDFPLNDKSAGWDGTLGGEKLPPDVFVYTLETVCDNGETIVTKGDVTLIR